MSDETIQYITTDYLIEVDGGEPAPAPMEYIVELGQAGVQGIPGEKGEPGFSPTVGYILNDNTFRINITNQDGVTQTPNLYDYFADKNGYLKVDGSNADQDITINQARFISLINNSGVRITSTYGSLQLSSIGTYLSAGSRPLSLTGESKTLLLSDKAYYNEVPLATTNDISNDTITITQGGVTKGTFTLNGSATTIDLDAGGGSITNPLEIISDNGNQSIFLGFENNSSKILFAEELRTTGGSAFTIPLHAISSSSNPITLTTNSTSGLTSIGLAYDSTTLGINSDNELYVIGGGGTTYTAGTGIDITSGVISIDTDVVAQLSDIPDVSNFVTNSSLATTLQSYVLSSSLATVATSGSYNDLLNKPTIPTNSDYVDLTTDQTVGGTKTFSNDQYFGGYIYLDGSSNAQGVVHKVGNTRKHLVLRNNQASTVYVGNTYDALQLRGSGTRPSYYANNTSKDIALTDDIPTDYVTRTTNQVGTGAYITGNKQFAGTVYLSAGKVIIQNNNNTQNIGLINNTSDLQISTYSNKNIKFAPNGTGKLYYGSNEVATVNDIPSISNLADKDLSNLSTTGQNIIDGKADKDLSNITTVNTPITTTATNPLVNKLTDADITVAPSSRIDSAIVFRDNNDNNLAGFSTTRYTNGIQSAQMTAINKITGTEKGAYINVHVDSSGDDHCDASAGVKKSIAQMFVDFGTKYTVSFDASRNFTPTTNGFLQVSVTSAGSGSMGYLATAGLNISLGHETSGFVATGIIPVQAAVVCHIDLFNGAYVSGATFIPNGRA